MVGSTDTMVHNPALHDMAHEAHYNRRVNRPAKPSVEAKAKPEP
jgi:hypothetical protein